MMAGIENQLRFLVDCNKNREGFAMATSFLEGHFKPDMLSYFSVQQFVLLNIKNVTLKLIFVEDLVKDLLKSIGKTYPTIGISALEAGIKYGLVDTGCYLSYPPVKVHDCPYCLSPSVESAFFGFLTTVSTGNGPSEERFNILGLKGSVWIATTLSIIVLSILLLGFKLAAKKATWCFEELVSCIWHFTSDLLQNAQDLKTDLPGVKYLILGWLLASSVLMKSYSSNLKGEMLLNNNEMINGIQDLVARKDIAPVIPEYSAVATQIKDTQSGEFALLKKLIKERKYDAYYTDYRKISETVWNGKYAFFMYGPIANAYIKIAKSFLKKSGRVVYLGNQKYSVNYVHLFYNRNLSSTILEQVDYLTTRFVETDQLFPQKSSDTWNVRDLIYHRGYQMSAITPLTLFFLWPVFKAWILGIVASMILATIELFSKKSRF